jgi:hypothetical protein
MIARSVVRNAIRICKDQVSAYGRAFFALHISFLIHRDDEVFLNGNAQEREGLRGR